MKLDYNSLNKIFAKYEINTPLRKAYFLARCDHESKGFTTFAESLNYSVAGLIETFSRSRISIGQCNLYGRTSKRKANQQAIADIIYGGVWGKKNLGNLVPGDGWKHRGAGAIQLTGRSNQERYFAYIGEPCAPELLQTMAYALDSAGWFWKTNNANKYADLDDLDGVCDVINKGSKTAKVGDSLGYGETKMLLAKYKKELGI